MGIIEKKTWVKKHLEHAQQELSIDIDHIQCTLFNFSFIPNHELEKMDFTKWEII